MSNHPVENAFPDGGDTSATEIQQFLAAGLKWVLDDGDDIQDIDLTGLAPLAVEVNGVTFNYDAADNSSVHNGVTVIVSDDGKRYKSALNPGAFVNVISIRNDPPVSPAPAAGDKYIVGAAPTGDWASNANDLTYFDGLDWVFTSPEIGQDLYVRDVRGRYHWSEDGEWEEGSGAFTVGEGDVTPREMRWPWGAAVEYESATPPASSPTIAEGTLYIVAANATGAWDDQDTNIAEADGAGGWTFYEPYDGALVLDRSVEAQKRFKDATGAWISAGGAWLVFDYHNTVSGSTTDLDEATGYSYSSGTAPTTGQDRRSDDVTVTFQASFVGQPIRIRWNGVAASAVSITAFGLFRDSEVNAIDWKGGPPTYDTGINIACEFVFAAQDTSSHTYKIALMGNGSRPAAPTRRTITLEAAAD